MAKEWKKQQREEEKVEETKSTPAVKEEMTMAEAKAWRASLAPLGAKVVSEQEKREAFRVFWAQEKSKYGKKKDLEEILWLHLQATKQDQPEQFEQGLAHFGLKKIR